MESQATSTLPTYEESLLNEDLFLVAEKKAKEKLARIIEREGDLNGERRKPEYLVQLIIEAIKERKASKHTIGRYLEIKEKPTAVAVGQF